MGSELTPKIQTLLGDLQAQLGQVVRQGDESEGDKTIESCQGILTPADEIQFWATYSGRTIDIDNSNVIGGRLPYLHHRSYILLYHFF